MPDRQQYSEITRWVRRWDVTKGISGQPYLTVHHKGMDD